jgi:tryptophan synthase alpha chain
LPSLEAAGADLIEIGIPFSDPIADGPTIQEAFTTALSRGLHVSDVLSCVASVRERLTVPLVAMVSFSIVFRYGLERFLADASRSGIDGLILPDLPPPEAQSVCGRVRSAGLDTVLLVAPTTRPERREQIASLSSGFVYYLSVSGVTGERAALPNDLRENVLALRAMTDRPVCVGFGISTREQVASLRGVADGAIVGSALVRRMKQAGENPQAVARAAADLCRDLSAGCVPA